MDTSSLPTRREFLASSGSLVGSGWLLLNLPLLSSLAACARDAAERGDPLATLTAAEALAFSAFAARIIPSGDGTPGATEAGAVYFADAALAGPFAGMLEPVRKGLADLDRRAEAAHGGAFGELEPAQQDAIIREVEQAPSPFFGMARVLTVAGVFSEPLHGGNRDGVGWALLDMERAPVFAPPFGHYDAREASGGAA
ncbi:MAG: gluconate 2-dehydrogenase subunit 3 family protein [Longimicrobiales bacterium]